MKFGKLISILISYVNKLKITDDKINKYKINSYNILIKKILNVYPNDIICDEEKINDLQITPHMKKKLLKILIYTS